MATDRLLQAVEFVVWVCTVAGLVVAFGLGVGLLTGSGLLGAKYALFIVGFLLFGVGTLALQPDSPKGEKRWVSFDDKETRIDEVVQRVPPLDEADVPVDRRVGYGAKLFVVSLVVLGVSLVLEVVFDAHV